MRIKHFTMLKGNCRQQEQTGCPVQDWVNKNSKILSSENSAIIDGNSKIIRMVAYLDILIFVIFVSAMT